MKIVFDFRTEHTCVLDWDIDVNGVLRDARELCEYSDRITLLSKIAKSIKQEAEFYLSQGYKHFTVSMTDYYAQDVQIELS